MKFEGQILDAHTGFPMEDVDVKCFGPEGVFQGQSNNKGLFKFTGLGTGRWCFTLAKPPYAPQKCNCVLAGSDMQVNLYMELETLPDEVITG